MGCVCDRKKLDETQLTFDEPFSSRFNKRSQILNDYLDTETNIPGRENIMLNSYREKENILEGKPI